MHVIVMVMVTVMVIVMIMVTSISYKLCNFRTKLLPNLPDKSVVVLDKASYHMHLAEEIKRPSSSGWAKDKIVDWLIEQGETQPREVLNKKFIPELLVDCRKWGTEKQYKVSASYQSMCVSCRRCTCYIIWML